MSRLVEDLHGVAESRCTLISLIPPDEMNSLDQCFAHMVTPFALVSTTTSIYVLWRTPSKSKPMSLHMNSCIRLLCVHGVIWLLVYEIVDHRTRNLRRTIRNITVALA
ncbi:hypothetical protein BDV97DRAFT_75273 [Delphinella strobiligena]|nr:hypothetical protein BDV97DRAFT_75273 [Delphinella strobiligena]